MISRVLEKIEWPLLLGRISRFAQTGAGVARIIAKSPDMKSMAAISARWQRVSGHIPLVRQGYFPPIGELEPIDEILHGASLGRILVGVELRDVHRVVDASQLVCRFAKDFEVDGPSLRRYAVELVPLPKLAAAINKAIDTEGHLRDDASPEFARIRRQKTILRRRVEDRLKKLLRDDDIGKYIQDDFFTVRAQRYVVPISLDGRGRVPGVVLDTSASGQTLFVEPTAITSLNHELCELDLAEKLEIARIFTSLSQAVVEDAPTLSDNYELLIDLDVESAEARYAESIDATTIELCHSPEIALIQARHPLIERPDGGGAVANDISMEPDQLALIISGPNAGGKTVVLKTVGIIHTMAKAGLLIPADPASRLYLFDRLHIEMGDAQSLTGNLSTFSGHISGLSPIVEQAGQGDLVLLDELAAGTEPQTGAALAQALIERLVYNQATVLVTTHYDSLKTLAMSDQRFRNASMEYMLQSLQPTYRLVLDVPGQSYGLEVARKNGLDQALVSRAKELRGSELSRLEKAISELNEAEQIARQTERVAKVSQRQADDAKSRWQHELELFEKTKHARLRELEETYDDQYRDLRKTFEQQIGALKQSAGKTDGEMIQAKSAARKAIDGMGQSLAELSKLSRSQDKIPGRPYAGDRPLAGDRVYVVKLAKEGLINVTPDPTSKKVEVLVGALSLKVIITDLRLVTRSKDAPKRSSSLKSASSSHRYTHSKSHEVLIPTSTNSVDLRGLRADEALTKLWKFVDSAILRGEQGVAIIHGHGSGSLKQAVRYAIVNESPYDLVQRKADREYGGDGVTIVVFS